MYTEFKIIYLLLTVNALLSIAVLVLGIIILRKMKGADGRGGLYKNPVNPSSTGRMVYCRKCANRFDEKISVCPKCGTVRK